LQVKGIAEFDVTGMLKMYPVVCLRANHAFIAHLRVHQQYFAWVSLCSSTCKGCGKPQPAGGQKVDTHVFCCVVDLTIIYRLNLGVIGLLYYDMTRLEQLEIVHAKLDDLNTKYLLAYKTRDKRIRDKAIREARNDIANYSAFIPYELKEFFDNQVGANSLNFQHADDISQCIEIVEKLIKEEKAKSKLIG
jgi:hypothetical protein